MPSEAERTGLIAILLPDLRGGGVERVRTLLAREFLARGYRIEFVLLRAQGELLPDVPPGADIVDLRAGRFRAAFWPLVKYLRRRRPAALLAAMWPLTGLAVLAKRVAHSDCRLVVSEHNALSRTPTYQGWSGRAHRMAGALLYRLAAGVVCVSQGVREDIRASTGLSPDRMHVVYNPVRRAVALDRAVDADVLGWWKEGAARLIAIGSLKPQKDFSTLLQALALLRQTRAARLLILGEGTLRAELETLVSSLGLKDSVRMPGFVPDPYPYLAHADLFAISSAWEGLGNVIIEALVAGVPVVSTDCPSGPAEILANGKYGRLVPVGDPEALAAAMTEALDAAVDRDMLRLRGAEFSIERAADQYLALLDPGGSTLAQR